MHVNNYTLPRPPDELLEKCHPVFVGDPAFKMWQMKQWCRDQNLSIVWSEIVETSDTFSEYDHVAGFYFIEGRDATVFSLKFR
jgi:hypothetical protein